MKSIFVFLLLSCISIQANALGGTQRYNEHIILRRLNMSYASAFDTLEITAFLSPRSNYTNLDTVSYMFSIDGQPMAYLSGHKILITKPCKLFLGYIDSQYLGYLHDYYFDGKNTDNFIIPDNTNTYDVFYTKPTFKTYTKINTWNQMQVYLGYNGLYPVPQGYYFFGYDLHYLNEDMDNYKVDHINWYRNDELIDNKSDILNIAESGNYYAELVSNFGYSHYSDTIKISDLDFAFNSGCIDKLIATKEEAKFSKIYSKQIKLEDRLKIYPNPFIDQLEFNFEVCDQLKMTFELYTIAGIQIMNKSYEFGPQVYSTFYLNLADISPGLYFLHIQANEYAASAKIVKQ